MKNTKFDFSMSGQLNEQFRAAMQTI